MVTRTNQQGGNPFFFIQMAFDFRTGSWIPNDSSPISTLGHRSFPVDLKLRSSTSLHPTDVRKNGRWSAEVEGDNGRLSVDSRSFGAVPSGLLEGLVLSVAAWQQGDETPETPLAVERLLSWWGKANVSDDMRNWDQTWTAVKPFIPVWVYMRLRFFSTSIHFWGDFWILDVCGKWRDKLAYFNAYTRKGSTMKKESSWGHEGVATHARAPAFAFHGLTNALCCTALGFWGL